MAPPSVSAKQPADPVPDSVVLRAALRRDRIAARQALLPEDRSRRSSLIDGYLSALLEARPPGAIAFCWPMRGEFDCRPLVARLLVAGWRACQPVVVAVDTPMSFRAWNTDTPMTTDPYGIPVPATADILIPDVVLLPLVAFDGAGFRLGYGGGYFDRTLAFLVPRPLAIGVGFELARADSVAPQDHDIPLDAIVTEAGLFWSSTTG